MHVRADKQCDLTCVMISEIAAYNSGINLLSMWQNTDGEYMLSENALKWPKQTQHRLFLSVIVKKISTSKGLSNKESDNIPVVKKIGKLEKCITFVKQFTMTLVDHVLLYSFRLQVHFRFVSTPQAHVEFANFLS